jgi:predicted PurR-regulated permease PerM
MFIVLKTQTANLCTNVDGLLGLHDGDSFGFLCKCTGSLKNVFSEEKASETMGKMVRISVPVVVKFTVVTGAVIVCFISVVYLSDVLDKIRDWQDKSIFREEVSIVGTELKKLINVYFKIQFIIMVINAGIVTAGLMIIRNPYALVIGIFVGIVDALPIFGTGTILLPWALISLLLGKFMAASVLLIVYVITYFVREIMESKCMGDRLGIAPFTMLVVVFVGIFVYGLLGFILGPVSYCIIKSLIRYLGSVLENSGGTC